MIPSGPPSTDPSSLRPLSICLVSSELTPFAKTGGLGDVVAALSRYLGRAGHDVRPILPLYSSMETEGRGLTPVSFLQDIPLELGGRTFTFSVITAPQAHVSRASSEGDGERPVPIYFIHCPALYDRPGIYASGADDALRFAFLSQAAVVICQRMGWGPHVFHLNDWHASLLPLYLRTHYRWDRLFAGSKTLLTIHNIGYQGTAPASMIGELGLAGAAHFLHQEDLAAGRINFLKTGILYAGALSTVSRTHAREIQTERYGMGLDGMLRARSDHLFGIVNGVDYREWNPAADPDIPHAYSADDLSGKARNKAYLLEQMGLAPTSQGEGEAPLLGVVSRLTGQKGIELILDILPPFLRDRDLRVAVLGTGESSYEAALTELGRRFAGRVSYFRGYNERLAHLIEAGADIFLMPSRYEPCGLNQMYSQRYGTLPVVRKTGGLADTVEPYNPLTGDGTGFVFEHFTADGLAWATDLALTAYRDRPTWRGMVERAMRRDFSWETQVDKYVSLYRALATGRL